MAAVLLPAGGIPDLVHREGDVVLRELEAVGFRNSTSENVCGLEEDILDLYIRFLFLCYAMCYLAFLFFLYIKMFLFFLYIGKFLFCRAIGYCSRLKNRGKVDVLDQDEEDDEPEEEDECPKNVFFTDQLNNLLP